MELSLEVYRLILRNVGSRSDLTTLCRVSKGFQYAAERALYNTIYIQDVRKTIDLCQVLSRQPRVALLVEALTVSLSGFSVDGGDEEERVGNSPARSSQEVQDEEEGAGELALALAMSLDGDLGRPPSLTTHGEPTAKADDLPLRYWKTISEALRTVSALKHLNIHINGPVNTSNTWIFRRCTFQLQSFHCDLDWNPDLLSFLQTQVHLHDLYLSDFNDAYPIHDISSPSAFLPTLSRLECTFSEAASSLAPGRPITHLKTCFSRSEPSEKSLELTHLFSKLRKSTRRLISLDLGDSGYTESFSMKMLKIVVDRSPTCAELRYLGTVVLPIGGRERLQFYGLLMRLPKIACVEFEVSEWDPSPMGVGLPAFKALANELRLYCPSIKTVVFVHEFERTIISYADGIGKMDCETSPDFLWREA